MADVTISGLSEGLPNKNSAIIPYSDGTTTLKTSPSGIVAASPGCILQVVQSVKLDRQAINGTTYVDITGLSLSITPKSTSNKIHITASVWGGDSGYMGYLRLNRNGTDICMPTDVNSRTIAACTASLGTYSGSSTVYSITCANINFLDSPNSISQLTYKIRGCSYDASQVLRINSSYQNRDTANYDPITVSTITAMEIAG